MYRLEYLPIVRMDLEDLIKDREENGIKRRAAAKITESIIEAAECLKKFPYIGISWRPSALLKEEYRVLLVRKYMLFFTIDEEKKKVTVVRVLFGWQMYDRLLKEDTEE